MSEDTNIQMTGTAEGLVAFLDWAGAKGVIGKATSISYRTAVNKVFEIDGESWRSIDVNTLDADNQLSRFSRLKGNNYSPKSMRVYGNRFRAALSSYKSYLNDPVNFRGSATQTAKSVTTSTKKQAHGSTNAKSSVQGSQSTSTENSSSVKTDEAELVNYPFPLRSSVMVYLSLPRDLRRSEATRIGAFVSSLAVDPILELGSGPEPAAP
jgi:hypothetical protein